MLKNRRCAGRVCRHRVHEAGSCGFAATLIAAAALVCGCQTNQAPTLAPDAGIPGGYEAASDNSTYNSYRARGEEATLSETAAAPTQGATTTASERPGVLARFASVFSREPNPDAEGGGHETAGTMTAGGGRETPEFYVSLAQLQEQSGNVNAGRDLYRKALAIDAENLAAMIGLAHSYDRQQDLARAAEFYNRAARLYPREAAIHNDLGLCYARQGMLAESAQALTAAIELAPTRKLYRNNLATVLVEMGHADEAWECLAAVHGSAVAHYNVGYLLQRRGQTDAALDHFTLALEDDPTLDAARRWVDHLETEAASSEEAVASRAPAGQRRGTLVARPSKALSPLPDPDEDAGETSETDDVRRLAPLELEEPTVDDSREPAPDPDLLGIPGRSRAAGVERVPSRRVER